MQQQLRLLHLLHLLLLLALILQGPPAALALQVVARSCVTTQPGLGIQLGVDGRGPSVHADVFLGGPPVQLSERLREAVDLQRRQQAENSQAQETVLLELSSRFQAKAKMISMILDPAVSGFMKPVVTMTTDLMGSAMQGATLNEIVSNAQNEVPPDVARLLSDDLRTLLINELPKQLPPLLMESLAGALVADLGPRITGRLEQRMNPELAAELERLLRERLPEALSSDGKTAEPSAPDTEIGLRRAVFNKLAPKLSETLKQALVQTISQSLGHTLRRVRTADRSQQPPEPQ